MPESNNPFSAPQQASESETRRTARTRWWIGPVLLLGVLGPALLAIGGLFIGMSIYKGLLLAVTEDVDLEASTRFQKMIAKLLTIGVLWSVVGGSWIVSAWCFYRQRWPLAVGLCLMGGVAIFLGMTLSALGTE